MATQTQKIGFTIGKNLGVRLHEISLEHLNRYDLKKALNVWIASFKCKMDIASKLTTMELICDIDTNTQEAIVMGKSKVEKKRLADYPTFSLNDFCERCENYAIDLVNYGNRIIMMAKCFGELDYFLKSEQQLKQFVESHNVRDRKYSVSKQDIEDYLPKAKRFIQHDKQNIIAIFQHFNYDYDTFMGSCDMVENGYNMIQDHINKKQEKPSPKVQKQTSTVFAPCNILDKYDCGWLAPNGDFFGMNGIKAQMCHIRLAEKICKYYNFEVENHQEYNYLETHQFVKIDQNWILYDGYDFDNNYHYITDKQLSTLITYGEQLYEQKLFFGFKKEFCSTARLKSMDKIAIKKLLELFD